MTDGPGTTPSQAVIHCSFTVERDLTASPDRVYAAYADIGLRRLASGCLGIGRAPFWVTFSKRYLTGQVPLS
jgi:hypothetical protein